MIHSVRQEEEGEGDMQADVYEYNAK